MVALSSTKDSEDCYFIYRNGILGNPVDFRPQGILEKSFTWEGFVGEIHSLELTLSFTTFIEMAFLPVHKTKNGALSYSS